MKPKHLAELNPEQLEAVTTHSGPLLVMAGPGTGKTQLLSARATDILYNKKANPENILILTFTNSAAKAMKERLVSFIGPDGYNVEVSTFHSFARNYIIVESEESANYIQERIQITDIEKVKAIEYILDTTDGVDAIRPFNSPYIYRSAIESKISELKNEGITPKAFKEFVEELTPDGVYIEEKHIPRLKALALIYEKYEELKTGKDSHIFDERGRYDYDDMILIALEAINKEPTLLRKLREQYTYIMVDEFQDTNGAQLNLLFLLAKEINPNLCCVGDDDQSIFRFQGASIANFRILKERYSNLKIIKIHSNYRSTPQIIEVVSRIIKQIPLDERVEPKPLVPKVDYNKKNIEYYKFTTEFEELSFIISKVKELKEQIQNSPEFTEEERAKPFNQIAILVRKRDYILKIIKAFLKAGVPYCTDGKEDISGEKRVMQLLDVLELANINPSEMREVDQCLYRILSSDYLKIEHSDIIMLIGYVNKTRRQARNSNQTKDKRIEEISLLSELLRNFPTELQNPPDISDTKKLPIVQKLKFRNPATIHKASWAINRLLQDAHNKTVHSLVMQYIKDTGLYHFILSSFDSNKILRLRELRALTAFINTIKSSDNSRPGLRLNEFMDEINTRKTHGIPLQGELTTMVQDGVRILTAHGSKGLEFHNVIIPFCLQDRSWPLKHLSDKLPLPPYVYKNKERASEKSQLNRLSFFDETRLFYVASSRAKSNLIFTSSPTEDEVASKYLSLIHIPGKKYIFDEEEKLLIQSLEYQPEDELLKNSEKILKNLVKDIVLTPTKLNNFIECKRKFFYDSVLQLPGKKKQSLVFGNCVHRALELTYRRFQKEKVFPEFEYFEEIFKRELQFQGVEHSIQRGCLEKLPVLKEWYKTQSLNPIMPLSLEKKIIISIDGIPFTGKYDKVEPDGADNGYVRIIDYKTGKPDKHIKQIYNCSDLFSDKCDVFLRQLVSYKLLFEKDKYYDKKQRVSSGVLVFVEPANENSAKYSLRKGEFINKSVEITDEMVGELSYVIKSVWTKIQDLEFDKLPERDEDKCGRCDFDLICWPT